MRFGLRSRFTAEFLGTAFLVAAVIGSGIMGERLAGGNLAIALLANTIATGAALLALILTFGPISGAHFNPAVTLADALEHGIPWSEVPAYIAAQCAGGILGAVVAHLMFGLRWYSLSSHSRQGWALVFSEFVATFGLLSVIWGCSRLRSGAVPFVGRKLHHRRVLVHCIDFLCESSRHHRAVIVGYLRGHSSIRCSLVHRRATRGRSLCHAAGPLAHS
jgi:glycerol uptake facilitator-like aquaporin